MVHGSFAGPPGRRRPRVVASVQVPHTGRADDVTFLIDTGADRSLLSNADAEALGLDLQSLPSGRSIGVGGNAATALVSAILHIGARRFRVMMRVLVGASESQRRIPSVLGGDVLSQFGLYIEERRDLVLLFEPGEAGALPLDRLNDA